MTQFHLSELIQNENEYPGVEYELRQLVLPPEPVQRHVGVQGDQGEVGDAAAGVLGDGGAVEHKQLLERAQAAAVVAEAVL